MNESQTIEERFDEQFNFVIAAMLKTNSVEIPVATVLGLNEKLKEWFKTEQSRLLNEILSKPLCYANESKELAVLVEDIKTIAKENNINLE